MSESFLQWSTKPRRTLPVVLQNELAECGHACLVMVSCFWGNSLNLAQLRCRHQPSLQGITLRQLVDLFAQYGFSARALQVPLTELRYVRTPAVLHWNMNHFVVLKQVKKNSVVIHDPAFGLRKCSMDEVSRSFTGVLLEISLERSVVEPLTHTRLSLPRLLCTVVGLPSTLLWLLLSSLCLELLSLVNPLFTQHVIDHVVASGDIVHLVYLVCGCSFLMLMHALTEWLRGKTSLYLSMQLTEQLSAGCMRHLLRLPSEFFAARRRGDIQSKMQAIHDIQRKVGTECIHTLLDGGMAVLTLLVMSVYSPFLTAVVASALVLYVGLRAGSYHALQQHTATSIHQHAKVASVFLESIQAITPIKLFLKESVRFNQWHNASIDALNADIRVASKQLIYQVGQQWLFSMEHLAVVCFAALGVMANRLSIGMLLAFLGYRQLLVSKTLSFVQHLFDYRLLSIQLNRLSDIVLHPAEVISTGRGVVDELRGQLSLHHVSFQYDTFSPWVVNQLDLTIHAGEKVVLVGPSGCGKSTVLKLLMGLIQPTSGELRLDDQPLTDFGLKNYRQALAAVLQDDALLSGSIADNICFFDPTVDHEWLYTVAHWCGMHDSIRRLSMGYETFVGDMGSSLSGGQKQRLLLARALYKKPKILFLDEATSHLDAENERAINRTLAGLNITQVIVAHRAETIKMADRVITLA